MSYEEIDKSAYGTDVFTKGAEGRYAKAKNTATNGTPETTVKSSERKKRTPKTTSATTDDTTEQPYENGNIDETPKIKKKSRKTHENGETQNGDDVLPAVQSADGETVAKPRKKRAPKAESTNNENINPIPTTEEPVKKRKSKTPKSEVTEEDNQMIDTPTINELEVSTEATPKVRKAKKHRTPKTTTDAFDDMPVNDSNEYSTNTGAEGDYTTAGDISYDAPPSNPTEAEQTVGEPEKSDYETAITNAYNDLASKMSFAQYVGDDQWCVKNLPKSARSEPKSRIRKILPGGKDDKPDGKSSAGKSANQKGGFLSRIRTGVSSLVRDENNLLFGERSNYDLGYYEDEDEGVDTDDLHRYAQRLRELEDTDREVNPEFLILRDGKTVYGVHEADSEGKMTLATRKPIYDRFGDQTPDDEPEKKKLLSRLKNPFTRNKDKDGKGSNSPKSANGTPNPGGKRGARKTANKNGADDLASNDPPVD